MLTQLLESLGIGGAEQNPLDGAVLGASLETPDAGNAGVAIPAPGPFPPPDLTGREPGLDAGPLPTEQGLDLGGALGL